MPAISTAAKNSAGVARVWRSRECNGKSTLSDDLLDGL